MNMVNITTLPQTSQQVSSILAFGQPARFTCGLVNLLLYCWPIRLVDSSQSVCGIHLHGADFTPTLAFGEEKFMILLTFNDVGQANRIQQSLLFWSYYFVWTSSNFKQECELVNIVQCFGLILRKKMIHLQKKQDTRVSRLFLSCQQQIPTERASIGNCLSLAVL